MASKQVADRAKSSTMVTAAATTHSEAIQMGAEQLLSPHLKKGESMPNLQLVPVLLARALSAATAAMVSADDAHEMELSDDDGHREARELAIQELYAKLVEASEIVGGLYGTKGVKAIGLDGTTPRDGALLIRYAQNASGLMRAVKLGKSRVKGASFDTEELAAELDACTKKIQKALDDVARETREAEATLIKKKTAITGFDATFSSIAGMLSALLTIGGEKELAQRVRPSSRRPGQVEETEPTPEPVPPAPTPAKPTA